MDLGFQDKVVLVTGGAGGIGEGIVREMLKEKAKVVFVDRDQALGEQFRKQLKSEGHSCFFIPADLSELEACKRVIELTQEMYGRLDVLVNNAGGNDFVSLEKGSPAAFQRSLENNLHHYYYLAHYALPLLKKSQGNIVNMSSKTAVTGQGGTSAYVAAKAAILGLTREWALELEKYQIRVNAVIPAETMTPFFERWSNQYDNPQEKLDAIANLIPFGRRMTTIEEMAAMVVFIASSRASHITGQHLFVDGGYTHLDRAYTAGVKQEE